MPDSSLIGTTLAGNFRITGVIGEGGMATVYKGTTSKGGSEVAVKIMNPDLAKETRFVRRFRREARAASMLRHPNTVEILEFGVDQGYVFLAMELLRGFDLAMLLHRERRIPETRAVQIVVQVCRALSAAHEQSIIHRDLKPDNIMLVPKPAGQPAPIAGLSANDFVKVLDFGIAKILDDDGDKGAGAAMDPRAEPITQEKSMLTRVGTIVGTPAYMAPEQGRAEAVDARTDLYACGVLLYELITGRVPFTGETPMQVVMRHVNEPPRPPSDFTPVHPEVERLIMRALAKYPSERQQSAEEMAFDLLRVLPLLSPATAAAPQNDLANKTLVLDHPPSPGGPPATVAYPAPPPTAPRPAAGVPAAGRAAGGAGVQAAVQAHHPATTRQAPPPPPPRPPVLPSTDGVGASPFPTLNIEVPDDIFPQGLLQSGAGPGSASPSDPEPTRRMDVPRAAQPGVRVQPLPPVPPRPAAGAPATARIARPGSPPGSPLGSPLGSPVPLVVPGAERGGLDQTMQSPQLDSVPPSIAAYTGPSEDEEEAPTVLKSPTEADKARMSLAEEAMAKALGQGLPTFTDESVEPTLVAGAQAGAHPQETTRVSNAPPALNVGSSGTMSLKDLSATIPLDPEQVEKAVLDAVRERSASSPSLKGPPLPTPSGSDPGKREPTPLPLDRPARKPTSELIPIHLDDATGAAPGAATNGGTETVPGASPSQPGGGSAAEAPLVWEPRGKRLTGPTALVVGIAIGAVLVAVFIGVLLLLRGDAPN